MDPLSVASSVAGLIDSGGRLLRVLRDTSGALDLSSLVAKVQNLCSLLHALEFDDGRIPGLLGEPVSIVESLSPVLRECKSTLDKIQRALEMSKRMGKRGQLATRTLIRNTEKDLSGQLQQLQLLYVFLHPPRNLRALTVFGSHQLTSLRSALRCDLTKYRCERASNRDNLATERWPIHLSDPADDRRTQERNQGVESGGTNEDTVNSSNDTSDDGDWQQIESAPAASTVRYDGKMTPLVDSVLDMPASKQRGPDSVPQLAATTCILAATISRPKQRDLFSPRSDALDPEGGAPSLPEKFVGTFGLAPHPASANAPFSELGLDRHACQQKRRWDTALMAAAGTGATVMRLWDALYRQTLGVGIDGKPLDTSIQAPDFLYTNLTVASTIIHPAMLIIGILANTTALMLYYHLHRGEKYQDVLLIAVVGTGAALSFFLADLDASAILLRVTPWLGILALLWSTYGPGMNKKDMYNVRAWK